MSEWKIGVLALQGDFQKHIETLSKIEGVFAFPVRTALELEAADALVIPGGESTTIGKLMDRFGLLEVIRAEAKAGKPMFGTCAGMILLASRIRGSDQLRLGLMDIEVARNAYGRQIESFEADVMVPVLGEEPLRAIFIRAPQVVDIGEGVEVLSRFENLPVVIRQDNLLAVNFHTELSGDTRLHRYFLTFLAGTTAQGSSVPDCTEEICHTSV